ncbi:MAG: transposase [Firmicutes bacterium]|nr:transposase [Bacillota bacterium]
MSVCRNLLTEEQMEALHHNSYILLVTPTRLSFTKEFKELFYSENQAGANPREILDWHGFDTEALGGHRIHSIGVNIRREYAKYSGLGYLRSSKQPDSESPEARPKTEAEQIRQLQQEGDYLQQEMEFLKNFLDQKY